MAQRAFLQRQKLTPARMPPEGNLPGGTVRAARHGEADGPKRGNLDRQRAGGQRVPNHGVRAPTPRSDRLGGMNGGGSRSNATRENSSRPGNVLLVPGAQAPREYVKTASMSPSRRGVSRIQGPSGPAASRGISYLGGRAGVSPTQRARGGPAQRARGGPAARGISTGRGGPLLAAGGSRSIPSKVGTTGRRPMRGTVLASGGRRGGAIGRAGPTGRSPTRLAMGGSDRSGQEGRGTPMARLRPEEAPRGKAGTKKELNTRLHAGGTKIYQDKRYVDSSINRPSDVVVMKMREARVSMPISEFATSEFASPRESHSIHGPLDITISMPVTQLEMAVPMSEQTASTEFEASAGEGQLAHGPLDAVSVPTAEMQRAEPTSLTATKMSEAPHQVTATDFGDTPRDEEASPNPREVADEPSSELQRIETNSNPVATSDFTSLPNPNSPVDIASIPSIQGDQEQVHEARVSVKAGGEKGQTVHQALEVLNSIILDMADKSQRVDEGIKLIASGSRTSSTRNRERRLSSKTQQSKEALRTKEGEDENGAQHGDEVARNIYESERKIEKDSASLRASTTYTAFRHNWTPMTSEPPTPANSATTSGSITTKISTTQTAFRKIPRTIRAQSMPVASSTRKRRSLLEKYNARPSEVVSLQRVHWRKLDSARRLERYGSLTRENSIHGGMSSGSRRISACLVTTNPVESFNAEQEAVLESLHAVSTVLDHVTSEDAPRPSVAALENIEGTVEAAVESLHTGVVPAAEPLQTEVSRVESWQTASTVADHAILEDIRTPSTLVPTPFDSLESVAGNVTKCIESVTGNVTKGIKSVTGNVSKGVESETGSSEDATHGLEDARESVERLSESLESRPSVRMGGTKMERTDTAESKPEFTPLLVRGLSLDAEGIYPLWNTVDVKTDEGKLEAIAEVASISDRQQSLPAVTDPKQEVKPSPSGGGTTTELQRQHSLPETNSKENVEAIEAVRHNTMPQMKNRRLGPQKQRAQKSGDESFRLPSDSLRREWDVTARDPGPLFTSLEYQEETREEDTSSNEETSSLVSSLLKLEADNCRLLSQEMLLEPLLGVLLAVELFSRITFSCG